jgi:hypothetical protein
MPIQGFVEAACALFGHFATKFIKHVSQIHVLSAGQHGVKKPTLTSWKGCNAWVKLYQRSALPAAAAISAVISIRGGWWPSARVLWLLAWQPSPYNQMQKALDLALDSAGGN